MSLDPREVAKEQFEKVIAGKKALDEKADDIIAKGTVINAGMGVVPVFINTATFMGVTTIMVAMLGDLYGYNLTNKSAGDLIYSIFRSLTGMGAFLIFGTKFLAEILKVIGIATAGVATVGGCVMDAVVCGAATYAIGTTSKTYFKKNQKMSKEEIRATFEQSYKEGKQKVKDAGK